MTVPTTLDVGMHVRYRTDEACEHRWADGALDGMTGLVRRLVAFPEIPGHHYVVRLFNGCVLSCSERELEVL